MSKPVTRPDISVTPERVVEILCRDPLGAALWRAAASEAIANVYRERIEQLERQQRPAQS
jgi:hypothetical protein